MAVPKKKTSKAKKNMRRSHHALSGVNLVSCPECGEAVMPHRACLSCGSYNGRQVIASVEDADVEETVEK